MGMLDKLKGLSKNLNKEKLSEVTKNLNSSEMKEKLSSTMESFKEKIDNAKTNMTNNIGPKGNSLVDNIIKKSTSTDDGFNETIDEKSSEYSDLENLKEMSINSDSVTEEMNEEGIVENTFSHSNEDYIDQKEDDEEDDENVDDEVNEDPTNNKKKYKNIAKGAMFVGSFLYSRAYEGADSGTALMHAFKKTKDVDNYFDGKDEEDDENKSNKKEKKKHSSKESDIKSIAHYEYIYPKKNSAALTHIDIPTVHSNGCPEREEAIEAIMQATGIGRDQAFAIWNGASSLHWRRVSYTYVNNGKQEGTVKG